MIIGIHSSKKSKLTGKLFTKMSDAILHDLEETGLNAVQIFTHGPRNSRKNAIDYDEIKKIPIRLFVHSSYVTAGMWKITADNSTTAKSRAAIAHIQDQINSCADLGSCGLVIHLPKKEMSVIYEAMRVVSKSINQKKIPILFEMTSVKPDPKKTYETPEKLNALGVELNKIKGLNWGYCVDTAHLWGAGVDVSDEKTMDNWFKRARNISLLHLNDAGIEIFGTGKDKHIIPLFGDIWKNKRSLKIILKYCEVNKTPIICEMNRGTSSEMKQALIAMNKLLK
jgi:deoxyribonuclease-4